MVLVVNFPLFLCMSSYLLSICKAEVKDMDWMVSYTNVTTDTAADDNAVPTVSIYFDVSKNKLSDVDNMILDRTCNVASEVADNSLYQISTEYVDGTNEEGVILIGLNATAFTANPGLFENNTLSFCVRADMTGRSVGYNNSISFTETVVTLDYDMDSGFEIKDVSLEGIDAKKVNKTESFEVDACLCTMDGDKATCSANKLKQNSKFDLCLFSLSDVMKIDSFTSMEMEQDGNVKFKPIVNSRANPFTQVFANQVYSKQDSEGTWKEYNAARVSSRVVSAFFKDKKFDPVILKGSVRLAFAGSTKSEGKRKLLEDAKDSEESKFAAKILLDSDSVTMKSEATEVNTKYDMFNVVPIIAACAAVMAFSIAVYLKKKE